MNLNYSSVIFMRTWDNYSIESLWVNWNVDNDCAFTSVNVIHRLVILIAQQILERCRRDALIDIEQTWRQRCYFHYAFAPVDPMRNKLH